MHIVLVRKSLKSSLFSSASLASAAFSSVVFGTFAVSGTAYAQTQSASAEQDDSNVITVIARKQAESLQEVPVTVTAIAGDTLERYQIDQVADVVSRIPVLNVQVGGSGSGGQLSLRGVGSSNISAAFDSAVALDFDGVQVSTMRLVQAGFVDTAQIDVLKGPQSLFFGKSATAGVFAIRSADPTPDWEAGGKASYEFEEKGYTISAYVSGPVTETFGVRLAAQYNDISNFVEFEEGTPALIDPRGLTDFAGRLTLQWEPGDVFNANFKLNYVRNTNDGAVQHTDIDCGANGVADPVFLLGGGVIIPSNARCDANDGLYPTTSAHPALRGQAPSTQAGRDIFDERNGAAFGETEIWFGRLKFDVNLSDSLTLSSVSGYVDMQALDRDEFSYVGVGPLQIVQGVAPTAEALNAPGIPAGAGGNISDNQLRQFTQEMRLASDWDGPLNFMVGAFYESRSIEFNTSQQAVNISLIAADPVTGNTFDYQKNHFTKTEALSFFGSVTLDLSEQLELSGGLRWTDETKENTITIPYVHAFLSAGPAFIDSGFASGPIEFNDSNFSPEVSLKYKATEDLNIYAAFKTGFKSGGIDNSALPSASLLGFGNMAVDPNDAQGRTFDQIVRDGLIFQSETGLGGEIGIKSQLADRTFTLNASIFYYVYDDLQVQNFDAAAIQFQTFNASQLTSQGVDIDWAWQTPLEGLGLSGSLAYTNAKFTSSFITGDGPDGTPGTADDINLDGREAARAPEFAGNFAFDWIYPLGDTLALGLNGNMRYSSSYFTNEDTLTDLRQSSYVSFDGSLSVGHPEGKWKLSLVGVNLTNKLWINTSGGRPFLPPGGDDLVVAQNRGRQVYVEARFRF